MKSGRYQLRLLSGRFLNSKYKNHAWKQSSAWDYQHLVVIRLCFISQAIGCLLAELVFDPTRCAAIRCLYIPVAPLLFHHGTAFCNHVQFLFDKFCFSTIDSNFHGHVLFIYLFIFHSFCNTFSNKYL